MKVNDELKISNQRTMTSSEKASTAGNSESEVPKRIGANLGFLSKEAYNLLRTNLMFSFPDDNSDSGKIIGITSCIPHEGKSTVALNLAYSLAENNYRVIAVECDFRRPSFAKLLNLPRRAGLSNFLTNRKKSVIYQNMMHTNLSIIFAGDTPPNPSELLGSPQMKVILDMLAQKYDFVIVDMPPVISVSDPLVLSKYLDGVIMVVRHNYTSRKDVAETIRQLKFANTRILGFVYNDYIEKDAFGSGYRNKYYGKYGKYYRKSSDTDVKTSDTNVNVKKEKTSNTDKFSSRVEVADMPDSLEK